MVHARPAAILTALLIGSAALAGCSSNGEVTLPTALPSGSFERPTPTRTLPTELPSPSTPTESPATPSAEPSAPTESATPEQTPEATSEAPTSQAPEESPTPTRTLSQAATAIPPSEPAATEPPTPEQSESPEPSEDPTTPTPEATESASETPTETPSPTSAAPTESSSPPVAESESATAAADESGSSALPLWLGLGALVAAGGALAWFLVAGSRRRGWDERLDVERAQGRWVVAELVPALTNPATPPQEVAQHWAAAQPTLEQLAASLVALVAEAPDDGRGATAQRIADATAEVRRVLAADVALRTGTAGIPADSPTLVASAQAVQAARDRLAAAIAVPA